MTKCATVTVESKEEGGGQPPEGGEGGEGKECPSFFKKYNPRTGKCELDMTKIALIGGAAGLGLLMSRK